jgi:hypothetical protein
VQVSVGCVHLDFLNLTEVLENVDRGFGVYAAGSQSYYWLGQSDIHLLKSS